MSQVAASNFPAGSDSPANLDDVQRAQASFIAQLRDGKGFSSPVTLASAATTDIGAQNALAVEITGTTTITSFGTSYNGPRFLRFTGALILTHNATTLNLPGAANITTVAGDTAIAYPNTTGNGWNVVLLASAGSTIGSTAGNDIINGSLLVNHDVTAGTTDNTFIVDSFRLLLEAATAATPLWDNTDVPVGAAYALRLTVGAAPNNKFGVWSTIDTKDTLKYRNTVGSMTIPLKATSGLVDGAGKIRAAICGWTGTANDTLTDPISAWGAEGTNPTLAAGWSYLNTPTAISVTTSWANYAIENISVGATINNLAVFIWSDDKANTTTTDILRVGGGMAMMQSATSPGVRFATYDSELARCEDYTAQTFPQGVAPAQAAGVAGSLSMRSSGGAGSSQALPFYTKRRLRGVTITATIYNPTTATSNWRDTTAGADVVSSIDNTMDYGESIDVVGTPAAGNVLRIHTRMTARI